MFHPIGKGSNGGYIQDSTMTDKIKHKIDFENSATITILTQENEDLSDQENNKRTEEKTDQIGDPGLCVLNSSSSNSASKHQQ